MTSFKSTENVFLAVATLLLAVRMLARIVDAARIVVWSSFFDMTLVVPLVLTVVFWGGVAIMAAAASRRWALPAPVLFVVSPFFLFFLLLLNAITLRSNEHALLIVPVVALGVWLLRYGGLSRPVAARPVTGEQWWKGGLLTLFALLCVLIFLGQNFRADRAPLADERSFWYSASLGMVDHGFMGAVQREYPGDGLHPFGVPFLNALPALVFGMQSAHMPFDAPVFTIVGLLLFLARPPMGHGGSGRWAFLFLLTALYAALANRSWPGMLAFSVVYGEALSIVAVLALLDWLGRAEDDGPEANPVLAAGCLGLLCLSKFPLILMMPAFLAVYLPRVWRKRHSVIKIAGLAVIFAVPFMTLKIFQRMYGGQLSEVGAGGWDVFRRLAHPNMDMLQRAAANLATDAENVCYYVILSGVCTLAVARRWGYGWPLLVWMGVVTGYYAFCVGYGHPGVGDAGSPLRYLLPAAVGVFVLGSQGWGAVMNWAARRAPGWLSPAVMLGVLGALLARLF